ncbi:MAG TPA: hypothetical protein VF701_16760, partial [Thermoanaerobaculia bacterium]
MNVLILHPEGNLHYNPNLLGLIEMLGEAGHRVTYVTRRRPDIRQDGPAPARTTVLLLDNPHHDGRFVFTASGVSDFQQWAEHDLVIGVDRGIAEAASIARHFGIPHALISYEIFFQEETPAERKAPEIDACRDLSFAVAQDDLRARKLCLANRINPDLVLRIPVAGRGYRGSEPKPKRLHEQFSLHDGVRTALYAGSLADWTGASFLLESTHAWPEHWMLIVHERFGPSPANVELVRRLAHPERIRISPSGINDPVALSEFVASADLGIATYRPTYENEWVGRNIEHIGLASGKIASYLQHGVPVAANELGEITDWIRYYGAGTIFALDRP